MPNTFLKYYFLENLTPIQSQYSFTSKYFHFEMPSVPVKWIFHSFENDQVFQLSECSTFKSEQWLYWNHTREPGLGGLFDYTRDVPRDYVILTMRSCGGPDEFEQLNRPVA